MNTRFRKTALIAASVMALSIRAWADNLIYNGSFEAESSFSYGAAQNWKMNDPDDHGDAWGSAARENWRAKEGTFLMAVRGGWADTGDYGGVWQEAEGRANQTYRLSAWFWADASWHPQLQEMKIEFWNWDRTELLGSAVHKIEDVGEEWKQMDLTAISPEGTEWVRIVFNVAGASNEGSLQVDDVALALVP